MSKEYKTTEFSLHLSRSKMRRYLDNKLSAREEQEVEVHLKHCVQCSTTIVAYVESEEQEAYKAHMAKLKGKLMSSVKPKKRSFTTGRIKVIRAAAAVTALFVFSFVALNAMVEKDFSLISQTAKTDSELPKLKPKAKTNTKASTSLPTEKKTDKKEEVQAAPAQKSKKENPKTVKKEQPKPTQTKVTKAETSKPKAATPKPEQKAKEEVEVKENNSQLAGADTKNEESSNAEEVKTEEVEKISGEKTTEVAENAPQPLQKIEKLESSSEPEVSPEAFNIQTIPNNGVGQLNQR